MGSPAVSAKTAKTAVLDGRKDSSTGDLSGKASGVRASDFSKSADILAIHSPAVETHVGADIRALRKTRGLTLTDLCDAVGRSVGWLSQVERGQTDPSIPDLKSIAALFKVPEVVLERMKVK